MCYYADITVSIENVRRFCECSRFRNFILGSANTNTYGIDIVVAYYVYALIMNIYEQIKEYKVCVST